MINITASKTVPCGCVPGVLEEFAKLQLDESKFPPAQGLFWLGFMACAIWSQNPNVQAAWPKMEDGVTPILDPGVIKFGIFQG